MTTKLEINLDTAVPDYAMFTELGNAAVQAIVVAARANNLTWAQVYRALSQLSKYKEFGEATDTAVREVVYSALNFDTPFYC